MPSKKSYNRFFIILQEDQKGYGLNANKAPSGYAKLEMRNDRAKTSFYVQDIKKQSGPYYMVLIAQGNGGNKELINLGLINIDDGGKADVTNEHDVNNIANTNIGMDKIQGAGICRINGTRINPVMAGFICGEELKNWATYPIAKGGTKTIKSITNMPINEMQKKEIKKETKVVEGNKKDKVEDEEYKNNSEINSNEDLNSGESSLGRETKAQGFDEYEEQIERLKEDRKKHNLKQNDDECKKDIDKDKDEDKDKDKVEDKEPIGPMGEFFQKVVDGLEKIGSKKEVKNCTWYKVKVDNLDSMYCEDDYNKYSVIFYPMICYYPYIAKEKSFMIGYKCDDDGVLKYIIYAIPGTKALIDQPYEGKTGFVTFMGAAENSDKGHWLMYYDVKKNSVVIPIKTSK